MPAPSRPGKHELRTARRRDWLSADANNTVWSEQTVSGVRRRQGRGGSDQGNGRVGPG